MIDQVKLNQVLTSMNMRGVRIDVDKLKSLQTQENNQDLKKLQHMNSVYKAYMHERVYPTYERKTKTNRIVSSKPNIQGIPKHPIRSCILPDKDNHFLFSCDYSQVEFMIFCDFIGNKKLIDFLNDGGDYFKEIAKQQGIERNKAKQMMYAWMYGKEGSKYFSSIFQKEIKTFIGTIIDVKQVRNSLNYFLQGSVADLISLAMINSFKLGILPYIQIHDALMFSIPASHGNKIDLIRNSMLTIYKPYNGIKLRLSTHVQEVGLGWFQKEEK